MNLALFDLDHTLIPFDSGMAWTRFLVDAGVLPPTANDDYLAFCQQYVAGTLDIHAMHRASVRPLSQVPRDVLAQWGRRFEAAMAPQIPAQMRALVQRHQQAGDLCAIVTATSRFIAEPLARLLGVAHLVATEPAVLPPNLPHDQPHDQPPNRPPNRPADADALLTGEIAGLPCYGPHKPARVAAWLAGLPAGAVAAVTTRAGAGLADGLARFSRSWFYSDSASDLPLLCAVSDPVAVAPDARLRAHALAAGWPIIDRPATISRRVV